jgi:uncharacterized protein (TIGR03437 family)
VQQSISKSSWLATFLTLQAALLSAQTPAVSLVVNAASNVLPGLPNAAIAQGAMFTVYGTNLGPSVLTAVSGYPLSTTLAGTSIRVTAGGRTFDALPYYTSSNQLAAILPSTTPIGAATFTVTYNGATSTAAAITVAGNNVGLYAVNSQGTGEAVVTFPDFSYVTSSNAAHPGDIVILWANGLGPITGDDALPPVSADMANVPLEILIGGRPAQVLFRGRNSCCASLDQINVRIPEGAIGCRTPVTLKIGNLVSNTLVIPTAASGANCTPSFRPTSTEAFHALLARPSVSVAALTMLRNLFITRDASGALTSSRSDGGSGFFYRIPRPQPFSVGAYADTPPIGTCSVGSGGGLPAGTLVNLDAGASLTVTGPNGNRTIAQFAGAPNFAYSGMLGAGVTGNFLDPGAYTIRGAGGGDIAAFSAPITIPQPLQWTNQDSSHSVNRANGLRVTWTGGDPEGYVLISGQSTVGQATARFDCYARSLAGEFTVPPAVLLALPAPSTNGTVSVVGQTAGAAFQGSGVDYGRILFGSQNANLGTVSFQ